MSREVTDSGTVDTNGVVVFVGGYTAANQVRADVYRSNNSGLSWTLSTSSPTFGARTLHSVLSQYNDALKSHVYYVLNGHYAPNKIFQFAYNDVYMSLDTVSWLRITAAARYRARGGGSATMTKAGAIILFGGADLNTSLPEGERVFADLWASLDGGYTFGQCFPSSLGLPSLPSRRTLSTVELDSDEHLLIAAGITSPSGSADVAPVTFHNDLYRSIYSMADTERLAASCGLTVPARGVGLRCVPGQMCIDPAPATLPMILLTANAAFSPRLGAAFHLLESALTFTSASNERVIVGAGAFITYGGQNGQRGLNDVWIAYAASNQYNLALISGVTINDVSSANPASFSPRRDAATCENPTNDEAYSISGQNTTTPRSTQVWRTASGITWTLATDNAPWIGRLGAACHVDRSSKLYFFGGWNYFDQEFPIQYNDIVSA